MASRLIEKLSNISLENDQIQMISSSSFLLLSLPEIVQNRIMDFLDVKGLLKLRLLCKSTKEMIDNYSKLEEKLLNKQIILNSNNLTNFLHSVSSLPITNFHLEEIKTTCFEYPSVQQFLSRYGSKIQKLRISKMFGCDSEPEFQFYQTMISLKELILDGMSMKVDLKEIENEKQDIMTQYNIHLANLKTPINCLKQLKFLDINCHPLPFSTSSVLKEDLYYCDLLEQSPQLKTLGLPLIKDTTDMYNYIPFPLKEVELERLLKNLELRRNNSTFNLKEIDLKVRFPKYEDAKAEDKQRFFRFVDIIIQEKILLSNVSIKFLEEIYDHCGEEVLRAFSPCVLSLIGISSIFRMCELPNLEILSFDKSNTNNNLGWLHYEGSLSEMSKLKKIQGEISFSSDIHPLMLNLISNFIVFLFKGPSRPEVEEIEMTISLQINGWGIGMRVEDFFINFPNLKILKLHFLENSTHQLHKLWESLAQRNKINTLELSLVEGKDDLDEIFLGPIPNQPIFLDLKYLKHLTISNEEADASISDRVLIQVFSQMELETFNCTMETLSRVTSKGLISLQEGKFSSTIKNFKINGEEIWKFTYFILNDKIHPDEIQKLKSIAHYNRQL